MSTPRRPSLLHLLLTAGIVFTAAFPVRAGVGEWTPLGPDGGVVTIVAASPADPQSADTVYAGTTVGVFRSNDGGATWSRVVLDPAQPLLGIDGVAFEPSSPNIVYASSPARLPYLLRSDDGGATWSSQDTGIASRLEVIEPDPRAPGALWTGGLGEAYHLTNGGQSLEALTLTSDSFPWIRDIDVDPADPRIVTFSGGKLVGGQVPSTVPKVFRTEDGGATWQELAGLPPEAALVLQLCADAASPAILYAATYAGLYRYDGPDGGWRPL